MMRVIDVKKLRPLRSSVELLSHQFLQKCSVSGTAKGKGKLKAAKPLKRSKINVNKGKEEGDKAGGRNRNEFDELLDNCIEATSPVRHLKPKEKEREAEREKMGLISKARAKEVEMLKKNKKKTVSDKPTVMGTPGFDLISLGIVDADAIPKYELTVEDGRRLAKEYSRVLMTQHRARQAAESAFLKLKNEALEALPEHLKAAALLPDKTPFPGNHFMPTLTPPIEGYLEKINEAAKRISMKQKLR